jgi:hypothetical protein
VPSSTVDRGRVGRIVCTLILPPDDETVVREFDDRATIADAIAEAQRRLGPDFVVGIVDDDSKVLNPDTLLVSIEEPRDLFVREFLKREIGRRLSVGFDRRGIEVLRESKVRDVLRLAEGHFGRCTIANEFGQILSLEANVCDFEGLFVAVPFGSESLIEIEIYDTHLGQLSVDGEASVAGFLGWKADQVGSDSNGGSFMDDRGLIEKEAKLSSVRGHLRLVRSAVMNDRGRRSEPPAPEVRPRPALDPSPLRQLVPEPSRPEPRPAVVVAAQPPPSAPSAAARPAVGSAGPTYTFEYEGEEFELSIPIEAKVLRAKEMVADRYHTIADYVSLLFCEQNLKDELILFRQRIGSRKIIIYIRRLDAILLQSVGYGSRRALPKPSDFVERVTRLQQATGRDARTCSRCLTFYDYDFDQALSALREEE